MKKITSLLLTAILLATMLTVFAVPASAKKNLFGLDPDNVGKWVHYNAVFDVNGPTFYYLIIGVISEDTYSVRGYEGGSNKYYRSDTRSFYVNDITFIPTTDVPQEIRNMAANDYPDLFPTGSVLSEGSLVIVVGVAAAVVFGLGGFFIGRKKKKPALASGENTDEE